MELLPACRSTFGMLRPGSRRDMIFVRISSRRSSIAGSVRCSIPFIAKKRCGCWSRLMIRRSVTGVVQHRAAIGQVIHDVGASRTASASHATRASRCCMPSGDASPACLAIVWQFTRGNPASNPTHEQPHPPTRLDLGEPRLDPPDQVAETSWALVHRSEHGDGVHHADRVGSRLAELMGDCLAVEGPYR